MKKCTYAFVCALFIVLALMAGASCKTEESPTNSMDPNLPSTKVTPREGDLVTVSNGLLIPASLEDIIRQSKMAFVGTVTEILPSQFGEPDSIGRKPIYTDVSIVPDRYLFGGSNQGPQIIRVFGGRVGTMAEIVEDEPTFTITERVLVFAFPYVDSNGTNSSSVLRIADFRGKYRIEGDKAIQDSTNRTEQLSKIESLVSSIKK